MENSDDLLLDLQSWFKAQCDGDWEHDFGVSITTMDNPGWGVIIDLEGTWLENRPFQPVLLEAEDSWIDCKVIEAKFQGFCGSSDLRQTLSIFIKWAKSVPFWLEMPSHPPRMLEERLSEQSNWDKLNQEEQAGKCQKEGCLFRRIQYSVLCRRHHYEQLNKKPPPVESYEVWAYGPAEMLEAAKARTFASVREIFGDSSVLPGENLDTTILTIEWARKPVELAVIEVPKEGFFKVVPKDFDSPNSEFLIRLFFCDFVEPACEAVGGVVATLNCWTPNT